MIHDIVSLNEDGRLGKCEPGLDKDIEQEEIDKEEEEEDRPAELMPYYTLTGADPITHPDVLAKNVERIRNFIQESLPTGYHLRDHPEAKQTLRSTLMEPVDQALASLEKLICARLWSGPIMDDLYGMQKELRKLKTYVDVATSEGDVAKGLFVRQPAPMVTLSKKNREGRRMRKDCMFTVTVFTNFPYEIKRAKIAKVETVYPPNTERAPFVIQSFCLSDAEPDSLDFDIQAGDSTQLVPCTFFLKITFAEGYVAHTDESSPVIVCSHTSQYRDSVASMIRSALKEEKLHFTCEEVNRLRHLFWWICTADSRRVLGVVDANRRNGEEPNSPLDDTIFGSPQKKRARRRTESIRLATDQLKELDDKKSRPFTIPKDFFDTFESLYPHTGVNMKHLFAVYMADLVALLRDNKFAMELMQNGYLTSLRDMTTLIRACGAQMCGMAFCVLPRVYVEQHGTKHEERVSLYLKIPFYDIEMTCDNGPLVCTKDNLYAQAYYHIKKWYPHRPMYIVRCLDDGKFQPVAGQQFFNKMFPPKHPERQMIDDDDFFQEPFNPPQLLEMNGVAASYPMFTGGQAPAGFSM